MKKTNNNKPVIFLNSHCDYGSGLIKWKKIEKNLKSSFGYFNVVEIKSPSGIDTQLSDVLAQGYTKIIAAGGDGTVNLLLNAIMKLKDCSSLTLGAIGLGSSNDFHKPYRKDSFIGNIPVKIDFDNIKSFDVIKVTYQTQGAKWHTHFCLLNASIGLIAEANAFFNQRHILVKILQRLSLDFAVLFTALRTIIIYQYKDVYIRIDDQDHDKFNLTNLSVLKNPHFTGSLCYDTAVKPDDGKLGIDLCTDLSLVERIRTLVSLANHRFQGLPKTRCWIAKRLEIKSQREFAVEVDGEILYAHNVEFSVLPQQLRICR